MDCFVTTFDSKKLSEMVAGLQALSRRETKKGKYLKRVCDMQRRINLLKARPLVPEELIIDCLADIIQKDLEKSSVQLKTEKFHFSFNPPSLSPVTDNSNTPKITQRSRLFYHSQVLRLEESLKKFIKKIDGNPEEFGSCIFGAFVAVFERQSQCRSEIQEALRNKKVVVEYIGSPSPVQINPRSVLKTNQSGMMDHNYGKSPVRDQQH
ncbi:uncharacterized protein LOC106662710 isoform X2 [Cimex lectularius]|uniref:Uncharacterized protein n=1 Tax=Cimex lectularius TaxID=79782 RepID=A0A8I6RI08_CIMLE|nr:uncharacterized protein LOC106662710 isoform X2 [Cimex lectularius]